MRTYNIFVSHAWKYSDHYKKIISWLDEAKRDQQLDYKNYSVPEHDPLVDTDTNVGKKKLKEMLNEQIKHASVVIILAGMYSAHSEWIQYELDTAYSSNKYIIGVEPWGQERTPVSIQDKADVIVGWNKKSVIDAILNS